MVEHPRGAMLVNGNLGFSGNLIVVAVPKNSVWSVTISDVPNVSSTDRHKPTARKRTAAA